MLRLPAGCRIILGDALEQLRKLPKDSIDCVVCSPPYWALRDYGSAVETVWGGRSQCRHHWRLPIASRTLDYRTGKTSTVRIKAAVLPESKRTSQSCRRCGAWKGQLGLEPTFELYLSHLCSIFDEVKRVLKQTGTCWVNLGDTYSGSWGPTDHSLSAKARRAGFNCRPPSSLSQSVAPKSLCLVPFRFAVEMVNRSWILRNVIIWHKPNCLPCSAKDRFTVDFEYVFFFTKSRNYCFEPQYEPHQDSTIRRVRRFVVNNERFDPARHKSQTGFGQPPFKILSNISQRGLNPLGRNKRCVWRIPTQSFTGEHFAAFPEQLCETPIKAGCPKFVCTKCGRPRKEPFTQPEGGIRSLEEKSGIERDPTRRFRDPTIGFQPGRGSKKRESAIAFCKEGRFSGCRCRARFVPGVVLDPFCGAGTTGVVAAKLGRCFIGIEPNPKYVAMAMRRLAPLLGHRESRRGRKARWEKRKERNVRRKA